MVFMAEQQSPSLKTGWQKALCLSLLGTVALIAGAFVGSYLHVRAEESARLATVSKLQAEHVEQWIRDNKLKAGFARSSVLYADLFRAWQVDADLKSRDQLEKRLKELRIAHGHDGFWLLDAQNKILLAESETWLPLLPDQQAPSALKATIDRALATNSVQHSDIFTAVQSSRPIRRIGVVAPLVMTGTALPAVVVFLVDP
ncbi:MAG: hypothetical protein RLZZ401_1915, partial [Pseudomonadota bacterium]